MQQAGIVPRKYLQRRTQRLAAFEKHRQGHTSALNSAIHTAVANGQLQLAKKDVVARYASFGGEAYRVLSLD